MSEPSRKGQVGIVGLGIMGGAIARNLSAAGWQVVGFDIEKARCDEAKAAGVEIAASAAALAAHTANILISLPKPEAQPAPPAPPKGTRARPPTARGWTGRPGSGSSPRAWSTR